LLEPGRGCIRALEELAELRVELNAGGNAHTAPDRRPNRYTVVMRESHPDAADVAAPREDRSPSRGGQIVPPLHRAGGRCRATGGTGDPLTVQNRPRNRPEPSFASPDGDALSGVVDRFGDGQLWKYDDDFDEWLEVSVGS